MNLTPLERRIVDLSYRNKLTHISSCLNTVGVLDEIYLKRGADDPVILGNSHAALALYVVLEQHGFCSAEEMITKHGTHASRDIEHGIWVSGGSLGQPETVAVGLALADRNRTVWLVSSDGGCMEGAVCEAMRFKRQHCLDNLQAYVVFNGLGAYGPVLHSDLPRVMRVKTVGDARYPKFLQGLPGHYLALNQEQYEELIA